MGPLSDVRVLDLTQLLAGPFATKLLADLGADVLKVERPDSTDRDNVGPFLNGVSTYFLSLNSGKASLALDLKSDGGKAQLLALVERADVLIENFRPGTLDRLGLGYEVLRARNPRLVYVAVSGFGATGPYRDRPALDAIVQGMAGTMSITGEPGRPPVRPGLSLGDLGAGLYAVVGVLAALHHARQTGEGQMVDLALLDSQIALLENAYVRYLSTGEVPGPLGTRHPVVTPFQAFPTLDGHLVVAVSSNAIWRRFCPAIGREDLCEDPRFRDNVGRTKHHAELEAILTEVFRSRPTAEWLERLQAAEVPCGPVNTIAQMAADPHVAARGMIVTLQHPRAGAVRVVDCPLRFSRTPASTRAPAPELGEHAPEVLRRWLGHEEGASSAPLAATNQSALP